MDSKCLLQSKTKKGAGSSSVAPSANTVAAAASHSGLFDISDVILFLFFLISV